MRKQAKVIPFDQFIKGTYKQEQASNTSNSRNIVYSFISPTVFFDGGTLLFLGAGIVAVGLAIYENRAVKHGDMIQADRISLLGNVLLQGGGIALAVYLLSNMPILHWL